jgi:hypothetical protein
VHTAGRLRQLVLDARRDPRVDNYRYVLHRQWDDPQAPRACPRGHELGLVVPVAASVDAGWGIGCRSATAARCSTGRRCRTAVASCRLIRTPANICGLRLAASGVAGGDAAVRAPLGSTNCGENGGVVTRVSGTKRRMVVGLQTPVMLGPRGLAAPHSAGTRGPRRAVMLAVDVPRQTGCAPRLDCVSRSVRAWINVVGRRVGRLRRGPPAAGCARAGTATGRRDSGGRSPSVPRAPPPRCRCGSQAAGPRR